MDRVTLLFSPIFLFRIDTVIRWESNKSSSIGLISYLEFCLSMVQEKKSIPVAESYFFCKESRTTSRWAFSYTPVVGCINQV